MANLFDYLTWRADVPFSLDPFNEVDNAALCQLAYADLEGIVPADGREVPLPEACEALFARYPDRPLTKNPFTPKAPLVMPDMAKGARFRDAVLCRYVDEIDREKDTQFSAVTAKLNDGTVFVVYRGTDDTVVGWREDFEISFLDRTEGQRRAAEYLNEVAAATSAPLRVGGHSKGGHLAVYAAAFCEPAVQERILTVYSNDGPGFRENVLSSEEYRRILLRTVCFVPDTSIIGVLFDCGRERCVVKSSASGILQHDGLTWCVEKNRFVRAEPSNLGRFFKEALGAWIGGMDGETRRSFTDTVFSLLESTGEETLSGISEQKWKSAERIFSTMRGLPKEKRRELLQIGKQLLQSGGQAAVRRPK